MSAIVRKCERAGIDAAMVRAIIKALGGDREARQTLPDIASHGADAGWSGFTYYRDTSSFFRKHRAAIGQLVRSMASDLGEQPAAMVAGFNCLKDRGDLTESIGRAIYAGRMTDSDDDCLVENALSWFALEEAARAFAD